MSLIQACADVEAVIKRARSLFGSGGAVDVPSVASELTDAVQTVGSTRARISGLSGAGVSSYQSMATNAVPPLQTAATSDSALATHMTAAAAINEAGAARMDQIAAQTAAIARSASAAKSSADQRVVLTGLRSQVSQASQVVRSAQEQATALAGQVGQLQYPKDSPNGGVQALDHDVPLSPASDGSDDPPHGKDPRYWIDVTKIIHVPDGQLAPYGTKQIGPNLFYPFSDSQYNYVPPPPPAKYPLDTSDITNVGPGNRGPAGTTELAPGIFAPKPSQWWPQAWPSPKSPIDIRDVIEVPRGEKAPWGYRQYLPDWWVPDPSVNGPR